MTREELRDRTAEFARRVAVFTRPMFGRPETRHPAGQLTRAATSVAANYRATGRARSRADFISKLAVVSEEADEAEYWLQHLRAADFVRGQEVDDLARESTELRAIFVASLTTARRRRPK